jgi:phosphate:Na+ symporter
LESFFDENEDKVNKAFELEKIINFLNQQIAGKLIKINNLTLSESDAEKVGKMFKVISDIERIGDHAENIAEYAMIVKERDLVFTDDAIADLKLLGDLTLKQSIRAIDAYERLDESEYPQIHLYENEIDQKSEEFMETHINRLKNEECEPKSGVIFTDMIINLERCADHAKNIARSILPKGN